MEKWLDNHAMHSDVFCISLCRLQLPVVTKPGLTQHVVIKWLIDYWNSWLNICISWYAFLSCQRITTQCIKEKSKKPKASRVWEMLLQISVISLLFAGITFSFPVICIYRATNLATMPISCQQNLKKYIQYYWLPHSSFKERIWEAQQTAGLEAQLFSHKLEECQGNKG